MYNFTNIINANNTLEMVQAVSTDWTSGIFLLLFLVVALFVVIFINLSYYNISAAFLVASFMASALTGLAFLAGLVPLYALIIMLILPFMAMIITILSNSN